MLAPEARSRTPERTRRGVPGYGQSKLLLRAGSGYGAGLPSDGEVQVLQSFGTSYTWFAP
jgi:hypothetical protein